MNKLYKIIIIINIVVLGSCSAIEDAFDDIVPLLGLNDEFTVIESYPVSGSINLPFVQQIGITFNDVADSATCTSAFTISPSVTGQTFVINNSLIFEPDSTLIQGTYNLSLTKSCENKDGRDLASTFSASFSINNVFPAYVQAIGLESQSCSSVYPGTGNVAGGNHLLGSCWWDNSMTVLSATNYEFRGGDTGGGAVATAVDCPDINTDNFRVIFATYMDTGTTTNAITLTRLSPPTTTVKIASSSWTDCQPTAPFGCRVVTLAFAEAEASCNGTTLFGNISTSGDFNLGDTDTPASISNYPLYNFDIDSTARDSSGNLLPGSFSFLVEGN